MKRRLVNLAAVLSLLVCVATVGLWVRSYWLGMRVQRSNQLEVGARVVSVTAERGVLSFRRSFYRGIVDDSPLTGRAHTGQWSMPSTNTPRAVPGFSFEIDEQRIGRIESKHVRGSVPLWLPTITSGIVPTWWTIRTVRRTLRGRAARWIGLCGRCGYDLRATPDRCPECGQVATTTARQSLRE